MDTSMQMVDFRFCKTCVNRGLSDADDPCNPCLEVGAREGTCKPVNYIEREHKKGDPVHFTPEEPFDPRKGLDEL